MGSKGKHPPPTSQSIADGGGGVQSNYTQVSVPMRPWSPAQTVDELWKGCDGGAGRTWELAPRSCGCHRANSEVGPSGSAVGDRESVTATTPPSGLQEPSGEPVPNNEVHLKSPAGGEGAKKAH